MPLCKAYDKKHIGESERNMNEITTEAGGGILSNPAQQMNGGEIRDDRVKGAMETVLKVVEEGNLPVLARAVFERSGVPSDSWSFMNRIIMIMSGTEDARGFRQWQDSKRYVKGGSHAFYILAPCRKKVWKTVTETVTREDHEGNKYPDEIKKQIQVDALLGFRGVPVFRIEDTEGAPVERKTINWKVPFAFTDIVKELGLSVEARGFGGGCYGFYAPTRAEIVTHSPDVEVFLHELAHAVDDKLHGLKMGQRKDQETIAEFSAAVVGTLMGYKMKLGTMAEYITHYGLKELVRCIARAEKVIRFILERTRTDDRSEGLTTTVTAGPQQATLEGVSA
jgi:hypothetical protein